MVLHSLLIQGDPGKNDVTHFFQQKICSLWQCSKELVAKPIKIVKATEKQQSETSPPTSPPLPGHRITRLQLGGYGVRLSKHPAL